MDLFTLIKLIGAVAYLSILFGLISGLKRWRLTFHKACAFCGVIAATIHILLILIYF